MKRPGTNISIGTDPEYFLFSEEGDVVPADDVLPKRDAPKRRHDSEIFADGVQAEVAVDSATCREYMTTNVRNANRNLSSEIPPELSVRRVPAIELAPAQLDFLSDYAREFGCDPSYGAWLDGKEMPAPDGSEHLVRYAGGHIHLGSRDTPWDRVLEDRRIEVVKVLDYMVGLPLTYLFGGEAASLRRENYGRAGTYRPKPYGLEYRTPGPEWTALPALTGFIFGQAREALSIVENGETENVLDLAEPTDVTGAINEADRREAGKLWNEVAEYARFRCAEPHANGKYYKALDLLAAGLFEEYENPSNSHNWGTLCDRILGDYPDLAIEQRHDEVYLSMDDFNKPVTA